MPQKTSPTAPRRPRVLVTGFHDWRDLGTPPNIWRTRNNPSGRLVLGDACEYPPAVRSGELARLLRQRTEFEVSFMTLPVIWGAANVRTKTNTQYFLLNSADRLVLGVGFLSNRVRQQLGLNFKCADACELIHAEMVTCSRPGVGPVGV